MMPASSARLFGVTPTCNRTPSYMTQHRLMASYLGLTLLLLAACGEDPIVEVRPVPPPLNGTAFIDPDILTLQDSTALDSIFALGADSRDMYDGRVGDVGTYDVWLFQTDFDDGLSVVIQVNAEFDSTTAADFATLYSRRLGVLPNVLREDLQTVSIHDGLEPLLAIGSGLIVHTDQAEDYRGQGFLEEVLAHEAVHVSLDADHANSPGWIAAQESDPTFISGIAQQFPRDEDLAETFGVWLASRWAGDGITDFLRSLIDSAVPARLKYFDDQNFVMYPMGQ